MNNKILINITFQYISNNLIINIKKKLYMKKYYVNPIFSVSFELIWRIYTKINFILFLIYIVVIGSAFSILENKF